MNRDLRRRQNKARRVGDAIAIQRQHRIDPELHLLRAARRVSPARPDRHGAMGRVEADRHRPIQPRSILVIRHRDRHTTDARVPRAVLVQPVLFHRQAPLNAARCQPPATIAPLRRLDDGILIRHRAACRLVHDAPDASTQLRQNRHLRVTVLQHNRAIVLGRSRANLARVQVRVRINRIVLAGRLKRLRVAVGRQRDGRLVNARSGSRNQ
jgi:hypothetical protein